MARIIPRGRKKWLVRVFEGRDPVTGRQLFKNKTIVGTKDDAKDWAYQEERARKLTGGARCIVGDLLDWLVTDYRVNGKSLYWCELVVRVHLRPYFGEVPSATLTTDHAQRYVAMRQGEGAAAGTINRELGLLRRSLNLAYRCTPPKIGRVPFIPVLEEHNVRRGFFEDAEYRALFAALPEYLRPVLAFGYYTGCRKGEILSLEWSQVDLLNGTVRLEPGTTKNRRGRTIPLDLELVQVLTMQKAIRDALFPNCPYVFSLEGKPFRDFRGSWITACHAAGLWKGDEETGKPTKLFHDLRRTAVRNLVRAGNAEKLAMEISGHRTRAVFDRYDITAEQDLKNAVQRQHEYLADVRRKASEKTEPAEVNGASDTMVTQPPQRAS